MGDYNWRQNKQAKQGNFRPLPPPALAYDFSVS